MKNSGVKILVLCVILSLIFQSALVTQADISAAGIQTDDEIYAEAEDILYGLGIIAKNGYKPYEFVTRAEFADIMVNFLGWGSAYSDDNEVRVNDKFLGYTNDPEFDANGDWIWDKLEEFDKSETYAQYATPFKDVLTTHKYWDSIKLVAGCGLMLGDGNDYFRPDDKISLIEVEKISAFACGSAHRIGNNFPNDVITEAARLKLIVGVNAKAADETVTFRDIAVMLSNALEANVYEAISYTDNGVNYRVSKDETVLSYYRGIYLADGIVTKNSITSLTDIAGTDCDAVEVDGIRYDTPEKNYDYLLGQAVDVYYTTPKFASKPQAVYVRNNGTGKELTVDAEDITGYKNNYLTYRKNGGSEKKEYLGIGSANIIYNGKALTDYTQYGESIIVPKTGSIRFIDADSNGKYETVFIDNVETVLVSGVNIPDGIIYNKFDISHPIDIDDGYVSITDTTGREYTISDIFINNVLSVKRTLETQGEKATDIKVSARVVTGAVDSYNRTKKELTVSGSDYEHTDDFDTSLIELGRTASFYIDSFGKIVYATPGSELDYTFLTAIDYGSGIKGTAQMKCYDFYAEDFVVYDLADTITINKVSGKLSKMMSSNTVYNADTKKTYSQVIKFKLNADGKVTEILTANVDENEFVELDLGKAKGELLKRRADTNMLLKDRPICYINTSTVYSSVPETDFGKEELYYNIDMLLDENEYQVDRVYTDSSDSVVAKIVLKEEDAPLSFTDKQTLTDDRTAISIVSGISKVLGEEGETCYQITGIDGRTGHFESLLSDTDLWSVAEDLAPGDLIRFETKGKYSYIDRLMKAFDAEDLIWYKAQNPYTNDPSNFNTKINAVHGRVISKKDNGSYLVIAPYIYDKDADGRPVKTGIETDPGKFYVYPTSVFGFYKYDSELEKVTSADPSLDILAEDETGLGSEVVAYTSYAMARSIFVFD